jgi:hypothetical protein
VFQLNEDEIGLYEDDGGYLVPEKCIHAYVSLDQKHQASLRFGETGKLYAFVFSATYSQLRDVCMHSNWLGKGPMGPRLSDSRDHRQGRRLLLSEVSIECGCVGSRDVWPQDPVYPAACGKTSLVLV